MLGQRNRVRPEGSFSFSSTLRSPIHWANIRVVEEDAVPAIRAMKQDGTTPLRTLGSLSTCRSLLAAGLVDRFRVVIFPVITGLTGRQPIFDGMPDLEMVVRRTLDGRLQVPRVRPHPALTPTALLGPIPCDHLRRLSALRGASEPGG